MKDISQKNKIYESIKLLIEEGKYKQAEKYLREYLDENGYEKNEKFALKFVKCLRKNFKYEEAKDVAESFLNSKIKSLFFAELVFINISLKNYVDAYKCLKLNQKYYLKKYGEFKNYNQVEYFLNKKINNPDSDNIFFMDSEENKLGVIKHIKNNHGYKTHRYDTAYFNSDIDIENLFIKLNERIKNDDSLIYVNKNIALYYYFKSNGYIGYNNLNKKCNIICVVTYFDKNIVTMYPVNNIDSKYLNNEDKYTEDYCSKKLIKRKSQIEKFNERYNIKD